MVFWFGDFNYRLNLENERVRDALRRKEGQYLQNLSLYDQLHEQRRAGAAFGEFQEGPIDFEPTYKYDNGTDVFDTSEKARTPSWTDRVLFYGSRINLREYTRGECKMSDHKPIRAVFEIDTVIVNEQARSRLQKEIYRAKMTSADVAPTLPVRMVRQSAPVPFRRPPSTALLVDLAESPSPPKKSVLPSAFAHLGFRDSFPPARPESFPPARSDGLLPPPSSDTFRWWEREIDEAWIPKEGDGKNPFYTFKPTTPPASTAASKTPGAWYPAPVPPMRTGSAEDPFGDVLPIREGPPPARVGGKLDPQRMQMFS
ncbi:Endonuclease/exonuclease/phosphatase, partial [Blyttiomyces helicus]